MDHADVCRPTKILHLVHSLEWGGLENGVVNVARGLASNGFQVDVCCLSHPGEFADRLPATSRLLVLNKPEGFSVRAIHDLARVIRNLRPDVLHTHNLGNLIYGALATGFGLWRPLVHSEHGELTESELAPRRMIQRRIFYRSFHVAYAVSENLRRQLVALGFPSNKIRAIANGVDGSRFFPGSATEARRRLGLDPAGPAIGIAGRFIASKRHDLLIAAFERMAAEWPHSQLLIVGSGGENHERVIQLARSSSRAGRIHLAGFQENPCPWYQAMDLFVLPSQVEGMSNVMLEAMACGVPVLSHAACGATEVLTSGENGFVSNLETPEQLFEQLRLILGDSGRMATVGANARSTVMTNFPISQMLRQHERLYREAARTGGKTVDDRAISAGQAER